MSQNNILLTTIKFKLFQDYFVKFNDCKALNLVQSNSRLFKTFKAPYGPWCTYIILFQISADTKDLLIEVTSSVNLEVCKKVMDTMLNDMLELGVGCDAPATGATADADAAKAAMPSNQCLVVEQVQILNPQGSMKVVYPARTDIMSSAFRVIRDYE